MRSAGAALFCLAPHEVTQKLKSELNIWYIDDVTVGGQYTDLLRDNEINESEGIHIGLSLNYSKWELITADIVISHKVPSVKHVNPYDAIMLGAPVSGQDSKVRVLEYKLGVDTTPGIDQIETFKHSRQLLFTEELF